MDKQGRLSFLVILSLVLIGCVTTFFESREIPPEDFTLFISFRLPFLMMAVVAAFLLLRNPFSARGHILFGSLLVAYSVHAQWFRPFYEYTYFQSMIVYTLLLYPPKRIFWTVQAVGWVLFTAVYTYRFEAVVMNRQTTLYENYLGLVAFALTVFWIYKAFSEERVFKEQALARFGLLGKHSATILHDLKSTMAIPRIYAELAEEELERGDVARAKARLGEMRTSLSSMQTVIATLNQLGQLTHFSSERVDVRAVLEEVEELLRPKLHGVSLRIRGEMRVYASHPFLFSLILNVLMNSLENFAARGTPEPAIHVKLGGGRLIFEDNGGGFSPEVLERLRGGMSVSTKPDDSGLGLFLLREGVKNLGGKFLCANSPTGAVTEIQFRS